MSTILTIFWLCFGVGLVYVLIVGALGLIGGGLEALGGHGHTELGHLGGGDADVDVDVDVESGGGGGHINGLGHIGHIGHVGHVEGAGHIDGGHADAGHAGGTHGDVIVGHEPDAPTLYPTFNPFSPLSIAGFLTAFGGAGLIASGLNLTGWLLFAAAGGGGLLMTLVLWLVIGKFFYSLQGSSEAHQADMIGLEAEVLTPMEQDLSGEIAYVLDGVRFTAPARLAQTGHAAKHETVRITAMKDNIVYVEQKKKLLS